MSKFTERIIATCAIVMVILMVIVTCGVGTTVNLNVNGRTATLSSNDGAGFIGALGDPDPTNLDADEWTAMNDLLVDDLEVKDDAFILGDISLTGGMTASGETIVEGFTDGAGALALATSSGTTILTETQLLTDSLLEITINTGSTATIQLPATSTMTTLLQGESKHRSWLIHNATSSTMAMTITAGTGIDLIGVTTNDDVIDETEYSELECWRQIDTDITCRISELLHVD